MPAWGQILKEASELLQSQGPQTYDYLRRKYLGLLQQHTRRNVVLYTSRWTQTPSIPPEFVSIAEEDMEGFVEVFDGLPFSDGLDLILHLPGGSAEATEALVIFIRSRFTDVRVFIPHLAMSAATMLACSSDKIFMGRQSFLGPIDPQVLIVKDRNVQAVPVQAVKDQFELAKKECQDATKLPAWFPILQQFGPALLVQCDNALNLSKELVKTWLGKYMFQHDPQGAEKARKAAEILADHQRFKTHARHIDREMARSFGLIVNDLEADPILEDLVLSVFHASSLTFNATAAAKIIENHRNRAWVKHLPIAAVMPGPGPGPAPQPPPPSASPPPPGIT